MSPEGFARERLGWWGLGPQSSSGLINLVSWSTLTDPDPGDSPQRMTAFAVEVDLDRSRSSIGGAGMRADGRMQIELVHPSAERAEQLGIRWPLLGTGWVVP